MKFGVREVANIVFKAKAEEQFGDRKLVKGEPVIYFDSSKVSTVESASTTVYAQGGRGNPRIMAWEGDKTATLTFEEALLSPLGFSILSGAKLLENKVTTFHETSQIAPEKISIKHSGEDGGSTEVLGLNLLQGLPVGAKVRDDKGSIFVLEVEDGEITRKVDISDAGLTVVKKVSTTDGLSDVTESFYLVPIKVDENGTVAPETEVNEDVLKEGTTYLVDYYVDKAGTELTVSADKFAGYYYIEADTLFRRASDGKDIPAQFVIPKGKVQSNFTFSMAGTGDPSTFTFTVDAMPDYTMFDQGCKVLFALNIAEDPVTGSEC